MTEHKDKRNEYGISLTFGGDNPDGLWTITHYPKGYGPTSEDKVVWSSPYLKEHEDMEGYPAVVKEAYERIIGYDPQATSEEPFNIVEMMAAAAGDECAFDQPCAYGFRVEGHAVYCHNTWWLYAPRKCRRTWYTGGRISDETCEGYRPNPLYVKPH